MVQQLIQLMKKERINGNNSQKTIQLSINTTNLNITSSKQNINCQTASQKTVASQPYIKKKSNQYEAMRVNYKKQRQIELVQSLNKLLTRRKSYCFQMLKLLFLFPDDTFSENISVNSYDLLFFHDEHFHTISKIYQTKQLQAKIWAFLNLKDLHKRQKLQKFTIKIQTVERNYQKRTKKVIFNMLEQYSISIKPQPEIKMQKLKPINTKIQRSTIRNNQTLKTQIFQRIYRRTQKIQRNNIYNRSSNQVIRVGESSSIVKRVQLSPGNGMKIIYPSTIRNQYERNTEVRSVPHRIVQNKQYYNQDLNKSRVIKIQRKNIQSPRQTIYSTETVKNIESAKIIPYHTFHPITPKTSYEVRLQPKIQSHYNDYGYLVHTVHGDCTINIYNGFQPQQKQINKHVTPIRDNYRPSHQRYQPAVQYQMIHRCCPCSHLTQTINFHQCHACTCCFDTRHHSNSQQGLSQLSHSRVYDIKNRTQYSKGLEQLNNKVFYHKHYRNKD